MNSVQRKKPALRFFKGLVGSSTEAIHAPKPELIAPTVPTQSVAEIQAELIAKYDSKVKRKRGRPAVSGKALTAAERKQRSRAQQAEKSARAAVNKAYLAEIQSVMREHRDSAGRLHGETSGGDSVSARLDRLQIEDGQVADGGGRVSASGCDPHTFERGGYGGIKETASQWANRQDFYAPARWNAGEKEAYIQALAIRCCVEECHCKFSDFASPNYEDVTDHFCAEHTKDTHISIKSEDQSEVLTLPADHCVKKFRCLLGDFASEKQEEVINHFLRDHKGYIRSMIRYHQPRAIKTPRTFSTRDDLNFVTEPGDQQENA